MLNKNSKKPLYKQLKEIIKEKIKKELYSVGHVIPTEQELCAKYGVSRHTVREAVSELVNDGFVERIQGKGTVVISKQEINNIANSVGIIVPYLDDSFISKIVVGVEKIINDSKYKLIFANTDNDENAQKNYIRQLKNDNISGLIIFPVENEFEDEEIKKLDNEGVPFVLIDRIIENIEANYVIVNNAGGAYKAVDYLINHGHRRIGFVSHSSWNTSTVRARYKGYQRALQEYNIPLKEKYILTYDINSDEMDTKEALDKIKKYLTGDKSPTAVFCVNDYIAIDILNSCRELNIDIPGDLSVIGFDNNDILSRFNIQLTTVDQPKKKIGEKAAEILLNLLENDKKQLQQVVLPTKLIERKTCRTL